VDTIAETVVTNVPFFDPTPARVKDGRKQHYDTRKTPEEQKPLHCWIDYGCLPIIALAAKAVTIPKGRFTSSR
jgi:hypothetical protein